MWSPTETPREMMLPRKSRSMRCGGGRGDRQLRVLLRERAHVVGRARLAGFPAGGGREQRREERTRQHRQTHENCALAVRKKRWLSCECEAIAECAGARCGARPCFDVT